MDRFLKRRRVLRLGAAASLPAAAGFYGEAFKNNRFYVFGDLKDMKDFIAFGEVPYSYTDIGAGPKGETLVYVMNKDSYAKGKPQDRSDRFKSLRMASNSRRGTPQPTGW